jgi:urea transport system ATP-binding protein
MKPAPGSRQKREMAILLVEKYFDFARELADRFAVMERGAIVMADDRSQLQAADVRQRLAV